MGGIIWSKLKVLQFTASSSAIAFSKIRVVWHFRLKSTLYSGKRPVSAEITDTVLSNPAFGVDSEIKIDCFSSKTKS